MFGFLDLKGSGFVLWGLGVPPPFLCMPHAGNMLLDLPGTRL